MIQTLNLPNFKDKLTKRITKREKTHFTHCKIELKKIPNLKDKLTKELLKEKRTHIKINDEIMNSKDSNYILIEVI